MSSGGEQSDIEEIQQDIEAIEEGNEAIENVENAAEEQGEEDKKVVKPKRVIRNPQPKLNEATLKGHRGIAALPNYFERVKFKGHGYEEQDLNVLLKTYEYWCHRLFPKYPFSNCIEKIEKLGTKKAVLTHIKRIRMDLLFDETEEVEKDVAADENLESQPLVNDPFDDISSAINITDEPILNEEQLVRMRQNRENAERLRKERLQKIREKAETNLEESMSLSNNDQIPTVEAMDIPQAEERDIESMLQEINSINARDSPMKRNNSESTANHNKDIESEDSDNELSKPKSKSKQLTSDDDDDEQSIDEMLENINTVNSQTNDE